MTKRHRTRDLGIATDEQPANRSRRLGVRASVLVAGLIVSAVAIVGSVMTAMAAPGDSQEVPASAKLIPPTAQDEAEAAKLVKEVYGAEVAAAKTPEQKRILAEKILQLGKDNQNDAAGRFVVLRLAKNIAVQACAPVLAMAAIDELARRYKINAAEMKIDSLRKCAAIATTPAMDVILAQQASLAGEDAVARDEFEFAVPLLELASAEAKKVKYEALAAELNSRRTEVEPMVHAYASLKGDRDVLATMPADPGANLALGKFECFMKGDFAHGLPMLAISSDSSLKALAVADLKGAASTEEPTKLGDAWWSAADGVAGFEKTSSQARAVHWYELALPSLAGSERERALSRIQKFQDSRPTRFLSELPATDVRVNGPADYHDFRTLIHGRMSPHTLWAHPPTERSSSHWGFSLDGHYRTFRGEVGCGNYEKMDPASPLTFRILGDGKLLWRSPPMRIHDTTVFFQVSVLKVKKLDLFVECPGKHSYAAALWVDPVLER